MIHSPYTGRVAASHVTPPHTVKSVKRLLCKHEGVLDVDRTELFSALSSESELGDQDRLQVLAEGGPGSLAKDPMALVINDSPPYSEIIHGRAEAMYPYTPPDEEPYEISIKKGDILEILDRSGKWWDARREDGTRGIVPSNYLRFLPK